MVASYAEAFEHYVSMLNRGLEGTVLKHRDAIWKDGTSKDQVKFKLEVDVDLAIIDIEQADPGSKHAGRPGALVCQTLEDDLIVRVAIKNEAMRDEVERDRDDWIGRIVVVRSNQLMSPSEPGKPHSLFLPRLVEANYRTDKTVADSLEQVRDQFAAAMKGKA
jgi:DNA ligase-1